MNFKPFLVMSPNKEENGGGFPTPPKPDTENKPDTEKDNPPAQEGGNNVDDYGYEKAPEKEGEGKETGEDKKTPPVEEEPVKDPASGYGDAEPKVEEPPAEEKPPEPPKEKDDLDKALDGLPDAEIAQIKDFAAKNKLTPEQVKAYGEIRKGELAEAVKAAERAEKEEKLAIQRQRAGWYKELKEDPDFGGEHFNKNVGNAEKVLAEFMPNTKKRLTESKGMLPPYLMRDLAKLWEHMNATERLVHGEPPKPREEEKEGNDPLAFYD